MVLYRHWMTQVSSFDSSVHPIHFTITMVPRSGDPPHQLELTSSIFQNKQQFPQPGDTTSNLPTNASHDSTYSFLFIPALLGLAWSWPNKNWINCQGRIKVRCFVSHPSDSQTTAQGASVLPQWAAEAEHAHLPEHKHELMQSMHSWMKTFNTHFYGTAFCWMGPPGHFQQASQDPDTGHDSEQSWWCSHHHFVLRLRPPQLELYPGLKVLSELLQGLHSCKVKEKASLATTLTMFEYLHNLKRCISCIKLLDVDRAGPD